MGIPRQRIHMPPGAWRLSLASLASRTLWEGEAIGAFESAFAAAVGCRHAIVTPSGRAALWSILTGLGLKPGDEVICPSYGYPVVPHVVRSMGFNLRLVDCELGSFGIDPAALAETATDRTRAIIAMHLFGVPNQIREICEIATARGAAVIEDCAHCFRCTVGQRHVGTFGRVGYFSFETSKMINTLGGGMITTDDDELAAKLRAELAANKQRTFGWLLERLLRTQFEALVTSPLGFNAAVYPALRLASHREGAEERFASGYTADHFTMKGRMGKYTNLQARLGLAQIEDTRGRAARRVTVARRLIERLGDRVPFQQPVDADAEPNYMLLTGRFGKMPEVARRLLKLGVDTKRDYMRDCCAALEMEEKLPIAARLEREVLHIPAFPELSDRQVDRIAAAVSKALDETGAKPENASEPTAVGAA